MSNNDHDPTDPSEGRVEVFYDGEWGTICSHQWNQADANVFCRQLGFKEAVQPYIDATHGEGSGPIWLDHLVCSGNEKYIHECTHDEWGKHDCTHKQDVSVWCTHGSNTVRLAGGSNNYGCVEFFSRGPMGNYMWPHVGHLGCKCRLPSVRLHKRCKTRAAWRAIRAKLRYFP